MKIFSPLLLFIVITSCVSAYRPTVQPNEPTFAGLPNPQNTDVFYPNYRMPQKPYYEIGIFEIEKRVSRGKPDNFLAPKLRTQKLDGAIVIDRHRYWDYVGESSIEMELISYVGIVYEESVRNLSTLSQVKVQRIINNTLYDSVTIALNMNGQITDFQGSTSLFNVSTAIQPWYFLKQKGSQWKEKNTSQWPSTRH